MKNIKYSSLFSQAFTLVTDNLGFWLKISLAIALPIGFVFGLTAGVVGYFGVITKEQLFAFQPLSIAIVAILGLLYVLFCSVICAGFFKLYFNLIDGKELSLSVIFSQTSKALPFFVLFLAYALITTLGMVAFVIPGVIAFVRLSWAFLILIDQDCGIVESLRRSYALTRGYFWEVAAFCLLYFVSMKVFFLIPIICVASMLMYRQVSKQDSVVIDSVNAKSVAK